jgi:nitroreductase
MNTLDTIRARRAVKHYDPEFTIPEDQIAELKDLIRQAPTSFNIQNWRFVFVNNKELRQKIRAVGWDQAQMTDASHLIVLCADVQAWAKEPIRYWEDAPKEAQDFLVPAIGDFYGGREWQQRDEAMRSVGIAAQTIMLASKAMGYDSCPMIGFDADAVGKLINLPKDHVVGMMIAVGKATTSAQPKGGYLPDEEIFFEDKF